MHGREQCICEQVLIPFWSGLRFKPTWYASIRSVKVLIPFWSGLRFKLHPTMISLTSWVLIPFWSGLRFKPGGVGQCLGRNVLIPFWSGLRFKRIYSEWIEAKEGLNPFLIRSAFQTDVVYAFSERVSVLIPFWSGLRFKLVSRYKAERETMS